MVKECSLSEEIKKWVLARLDKKTESPYFKKEARKELNKILNDVICNSIMNEEIEEEEGIKREKVKYLIPLKN